MNWRIRCAFVSIAGIIGLLAIIWGLLSFDYFGLDLEREESALLGFYIAAVVITSAWCYDWKHYIRYWLAFRGSPPYSRRAILIVRCLIFVWMAGAVTSLIHNLIFYDWNSFGIIVPLVIAIMTLLSFGIVDGLIRCLKGPPDDADWQNGNIKWPHLIGKYLN